mgnify:CR=1 FL=1
MLFRSDLAQCAVYGRALRDDEIRARFGQLGLEQARGPALLANWGFTEENGHTVRDSSRNRRHGRIVNHATWMIGGPSFNREVPRFEGDYHPTKDPRRGHGLRLASDDLYDCRWEITHQWQVPTSARPGIHVARIAYREDGHERLAHATDRKSTRLNSSH